MTLQCEHLPAMCPTFLCMPRTRAVTTSATRIRTPPRCARGRVAHKSDSYTGSHTLHRARHRCMQRDVCTPLNAVLCMRRNKTCYEGQQDGAVHPADENTTPVARKRFQRRVLQKEEQEEGVKAPVPVRPTAPARKESPERTAPRHAAARSRAPSDASGSGSLDSTGSCEGRAHVCGNRDQSLHPL